MADNGADVLVSNSWGGPNFGASGYLKFVFEYAHSLGVVCVAAARGNSATDVANILARQLSQHDRSGSQRLQRPAPFFSNFGEGIDVAVPGVDILSIRATGTDLYTVGALHQLSAGR